MISIVNKLSKNKRINAETAMQGSINSIPFPFTIINPSAKLEITFANNPKIKVNALNVIYFKNQ